MRIFLAAIEGKSMTVASNVCNISQPAVTQALSKLEKSVGIDLLARSPHGVTANEAGTTLARRARRAFSYLDGAMAHLAPRLAVTATSAQLRALVAVHETESLALAANRLAISQPAVHRSIAMIEKEVGKPLFRKTSHGLVATREATELAQATRLAFVELNQAEADLGEIMGSEVGQIVVGAMPLARSYLLPKAITRFRKTSPHIRIKVLEGSYGELLTGLRRGDIDFLVGALRHPAPAGDVKQTRLFSDPAVVVAGRHHPLVGRNSLTAEELAEFPWVVAVAGTPIRDQFEAFFDRHEPERPTSIVESSSLILMRELLDGSDHLGWISQLQAQAEITSGQLWPLPIDLSHTSRAIGITTRTSWLPTQSQSAFLEYLCRSSNSLAA